MTHFVLDAVTVISAGLAAGILYPFFIDLLRRQGAGQVIQAELPPEHQRKAGTPTGGGILFVGVGILAGLLATLAGHRAALPVVAGLLLGGAVGLADDLRKLRVGSLGIPARAKFPLQLLLAVPVAWLAYQPYQWPFAAALPWWIYWPLAVLAIAATANAVNLTDGIDALAGTVAAIALLAVALLLPGAGSGEKAAALALAGGVLAFLYYNRPPARVFMGDAGSLGIGYALAAMALQQGYVLALVPVGLVLVLETLSVIIQVAYFKASGGRRIFKMTPIHYTFQLQGWSEPRIVAVFAAVGIAGAAAGFGLTHLR